MLKAHLYTNSYRYPIQINPTYYSQIQARFCYSGVLTQASTEDLNESLLKILTSKAHLENVLNLKHRTFNLNPSVIHHFIIYIVYQVASVKASVDGLCNYKRMLQCIYVNKEMVILLTRCWPISMPRPQTTTNNF